MSNGSAGVVRFSLTTVVVAAVISADFTWPGVHVGCNANCSTAEPAMCGAAIDVPAIAWYSWPDGPPNTSPGVGV